MGLALLAKLLTATLLRDSTSGSLGRFALGLLLASAGAVPPFALALRFAPHFSSITHSIASRSGNNVRVDSGTVE
jgi:hypothetical protein